MTTTDNRAMLMNTIRFSLEHIVPIASDDSFDDLLARLDAIPAGHAAASPDNRAPASLARRDTALEAQLSGHVDRLATAFRRFHGRLATPGARPLSGGHLNGLTTLFGHGRPERACERG